MIPANPSAMVSFLTAGSFDLFPHNVTGGLHPTVAVPSRLYYKPSVARPLAGLRLAVKDIIDLKGLHTTGGCRAYRELYPPRSKTAPALQRLIDLGAIVVGKTRTGQFAFGTPLMDSLDYFSNLNPRGDGHQSQSGSSGGSAGAVAAYDWIDFAIGTDSEFYRHPTGVTCSVSDLEGSHWKHPRSRKRLWALCHAAHAWRTSDGEYPSAKPVSTSFLSLLSFFF